MASKNIDKNLPQKTESRNIQQQHRRRYKSGKVTIVNRGNAKNQIKRSERKKKFDVKTRKLPEKRYVQKKSDPYAEYIKNHKEQIKETENFLSNLGLNGQPMSGYSYPIKKGFLIPYLLPLDSITTKRWDFYTELIMRNGNIDLKKNPIPKIDFDSTPHPDVRKMLKKNIDYAYQVGIGERAVETFMDWILWGLHSPLITKAPDIPEKLNEFWYRNFDMGIMMLHPADHWAWLLGEEKKRVGPGWFATPMNVCKMMVQIQMTDTKPWESIADPCSGTGSMLLPASNYSLKIYAQDISYTAVKALTLNAYMFVPWLVNPVPENVLENIKKNYGRK